MDELNFAILQQKIEDLLNRNEQLEQDLRALRAGQRAWREERAHLIEKNELARTKVEAMIGRLRALEQD